MIDICLVDKVNQYRTHKHQNMSGKNEIEKFTSIKTVKLTEQPVLAVTPWKSYNCGRKVWKNTCAGI